MHFRKCAFFLAMGRDGSQPSLQAGAGGERWRPMAAATGGRGRWDGGRCRRAGAGRRGRRPLRRGTAETSRSCHSERSEESVPPSPVGGRRRRDGGRLRAVPTGGCGRRDGGRQSAVPTKGRRRGNGGGQWPPLRAGAGGKRRAVPEGRRGASGTPPPTAETSRPCHSERSEESVPPSPVGGRRRRDGGRLRAVPTGWRRRRDGGRLRAVPTGGRSAKLLVNFVKFLLVRTRFLCYNDYNGIC